MSLDYAHGRNEAIGKTMLMKHHASELEGRHHKIPSYVLDDLSSRFIINSSSEDMKSPIRILFQTEIAYWFYLDFHRVENPSLENCTMKEFSYCLFSHCSQLQQYIPDFDACFESWKSYKRTIATYGAVILDQELKHILLVQSFSSKNTWGFPKGKINHNESPVKCATREVLEEIGFDITPYIDQSEFFERSTNDQVTRLYIIAGVPLNTPFQPKTRREIRDIQWFPLHTLPAYKGDQTLKETMGQNYNLFMVTPYLRSIRKWISDQSESATRGRYPKFKSGKPHAGMLASSNDLSYAKRGKAYPKGQSVRYSRDLVMSDKSAKQATGRRGMTVFESLFGNKDGQQALPSLDFKAPAVDTNSFYSKSWHNFQLDVEGIIKLLPLEDSQSSHTSTSAMH